MGEEELEEGKARTLEWYTRKESSFNLIKASMAYLHIYAWVSYSLAPTQMAKKVGGDSSIWTVLKWVIPKIKSRS